MSCGSCGGFVEIPRLKLKFLSRTQSQRWKRCATQTLLRGAEAPLFHGGAGLWHGLSRALIRIAAVRYAWDAWTDEGGYPCGSCGARWDSRFLLSRFARASE